MKFLYPGLSLSKALIYDPLREQGELKVDLMHTNFDDGDWKAAVARYKNSVALPEKCIVAGLDDIRRQFNDADDHEPDRSGPCFEDVVAQSEADTSFRTITDDTKAGDGTALRDAILSGKWSVMEVTEAFLAKAALAQQVLGCFTEIYFDRARQRAKELDDKLAKCTSNKASLGALFGVPLSIKAHLAYEGSGSDRGFVFDVLDEASVDKILRAEERRSEIPRSTLALLRKQGPHIMQKDGQMVHALLSEGAVIIGKTTMPQSIMHLDTRSNLHGQTLNPHNLHLSPGGSSGGEAASVASGATLAGLGTDIGGSVRQPAACVGLFGMRPTIGRFSSVGTRSTMPGNEGVIGTAGPFARSLRDLELLMSVLVRGTTESDPYLCPPLPWRGVQDVKRKLRIGVMRDDGFVMPITPIRRALQHVVQRLQTNPSFELVPIDAKDFGERGWNLIRELYFMEDGALIKALASLTGEPLVRMTQYILQSPVRDHSAGEAWQLQYARETFKREVWRSLFFHESTPEQPLDAVLCPASALVAPRPQHIPYWGYTSLFNLSDLPGISFPVQHLVSDATRDKEFEESEAPCKPLSEMDTVIRQECKCFPCS